MAKTLTVYLAADLKKFNSGMDEASRKAQGLGGTMSNLLGPALIGAAAAAGAFATKLAVDGVQAAIADEAASAKLAQTLENLGLAHDTAPVEDYISTLERSLGIADDELRPAYDRLVRSIGNTEEANRALSLALDVSSGTGKSLDAVVQALGRAYDGNTQGLSRLGAGLDKATLATGDMNAITGQLAATFGGQATTQAATFQGQLARLQTGVDNLAEAFGRGLLDSLGDTDAQTGDLVNTMEELEPVLEQLGDQLGTVAGQVTAVIGPMSKLVGLLEESAPPTNAFEGALNGAKRTITNTLNIWGPLSGIVKGFNGEAQEAAEQTTILGSSLTRSAVAAERAVPGFNSIATAVDDIGAEASQSAVQVASMAEALAAVGGNTFNWRREIAGATEDAEKFAIELNYNAYLARRAADAAAEAAKGTKSYSGSATAATTDTDKLTGAQKRLTDAYAAQESVIDGTRDQLAAYAADLAVVTEAANAYSDSIRSSLMDTIDLGAAYGAQFNDQGEKTGKSLVEGFQAQIDQTEWFGNVLNALKSQGADASLISEIASLGAGVGGALGQQLLDEGLVGTINSKWVGVQETIRAQAATLVPEFLQAGIASGTDLITGLTGELQKQVGTLSKLGKQIAKPVGAQFKAQIAADIAAALAQVEAASSAARAEKVAQAEARAAALTDQAVAQALGNIIGRSDARTGRPQPNVPFLVLG